MPRTNATYSLGSSSKVDLIKKLMRVVSVPVKFFVTLCTKKVVYISHQKKVVYIYLGLPLFLEYIFMCYESIQKRNFMNNFLLNST